ncbi:hypothetical protein K7G95_24290 [Escherichia coli]|nr:hypothetical protein K7G95_24290 [Escherichia coli]
MSEPRFVHLRVHSDYSMIDGLAKTAPLVKRRRRWVCQHWRSPISPTFVVW